MAAEKKTNEREAAGEDAPEHEPEAGAPGGEETTPTGAAAEASADERTGGVGRRKQRVGVVTSDKAQKTVTVTVERRMSHPLYGKQVTRRKRYHAHDEKDEYHVGDVVRIQETRPLSRTKRWRVVELIQRPE